MGKVKFALEKEETATGTLVDALFKITTEPDGKETKEGWGNVEEFNHLFEICVSRWGSNWDLNKICLAITDSEID